MIEKPELGEQAGKIEQVNGSGKRQNWGGFRLIWKGG